MRWILAIATIAISAQAWAKPWDQMTSTERLRSDVGKPLSEPIMRNGQPESIIRINSHQIAVTFLKKIDDTIGGGIFTIPNGAMPPTIIGNPIRTTHIECRYTLIVEATRDDLKPYQMIITGFRQPQPGCD